MTVMQGPVTVMQGPVTVMQETMLEGTDVSEFFTLFVCCSRACIPENLVGKISHFHLGIAMQFPDIPNVFVCIIRFQVMVTHQKFFATRWVPSPVINGVLGPFPVTHLLPAIYIRLITITPFVTRYLGAHLVAFTSRLFIVLFQKKARSKRKRASTISNGLGTLSLFKRLGFGTVKPIEIHQQTSKKQNV